LIFCATIVADKYEYTLYLEKRFPFYILNNSAKLNRF